MEINLEKKEMDGTDGCVFEKHRELFFVCFRVKSWIRTLLPISGSNF